MLSFFYSSVSSQIDFPSSSSFRRSLYTSLESPLKLLLLSETTEKYLLPAVSEHVSGNKCLNSSRFGQTMRVMDENETIRLLLVVILGVAFAAFAVRKWSRNSGSIPGEIKYISDDCALKLHIKSLML